MQQIFSRLTALEGQRRSSQPRPYEPRAGASAPTPPRLRPVTAPVAEYQSSAVEGRESAVPSSPGRPVQTMMTIWSPRLSKLLGATMRLASLLRSLCPPARWAPNIRRHRSTRTSSSQERPC
ncbi:uncharacterized protein LOC123670247 [Melitaea cinxia]|uniref:uncharacterized protein LOC123670247 n=1 Tax=Melitaea cinxia TaxID=113334 RepID=UPI001E271A02|nr:uncharacterized protein LOC123670247 [Melitaea cinxia]